MINTAHQAGAGQGEKERGWVEREGSVKKTGLGAKTEERKTLGQKKFADFVCGAASITCEWVSLALALTVSSPFRSASLLLPLCLFL